MTTHLRYLELKTGHHDNGPAWIARVRASRSGRTLYFDGRALRRSPRCVLGNHVDLVTGDRFWVSGIKRDGTDRHWAGSGKVQIEADAIEEYLALCGATVLDRARLVITHDLRPTDPADFVEFENRPTEE